MVATLPGVRAGVRVKILFESDEEYDEHPTRIEDLEGETLFLSVPLRRGVPVWPATGENVEVRVPPSDPQSPELFLAGQVIGRQTDPLEVILVQIVAAGQHTRREYYRLPIKMLPLDCSVWVREIGRPESEGTWEALSATIVNLSAGGIGFEVDREVVEGARAHVRFPWPTGEGTFSVAATVKSVRPAPSGRSGPRIFLGCEFRGLTRQQRERILQCVHRYQVKQLKERREREAERGRITAEEVGARAAQPPQPQVAQTGE